MAFVTVCPHVALGVVERYKDGKCAQCQRARSAKLRATKPEVARARTAAWLEKPGNKERKKVNERGRYRRNPDKFRESGRKHKGIIFAPGESEQTLLERQDGVCPCCLRRFADLPRREWQVDHDHSITDRPNVRWLLCGGANRAVGNVDEQVVRLLRLAALLAAYQVANGRFPDMLD